MHILLLHNIEDLGLDMMFTIIIEDYLITVVLAQLIKEMVCYLLHYVLLFYVWFVIFVVSYRVICFVLIWLFSKWLALFDPGYIMWKGTFFVTIINYWKNGYSYVVIETKLDYNFDLKYVLFNIFLKLFIKC